MDLFVRSVSYFYHFQYPSNEYLVRIEYSMFDDEEQKNDLR
jgi:hypothetical protein